jgi:hypothetical protein
MRLPEVRAQPTLAIVDVLHLVPPVEIGVINENLVMQDTGTPCHRRDGLLAAVSGVRDVIPVSIGLALAPPTAGGEATVSRRRSSSLPRAQTITSTAIGSRASQRDSRRDIGGVLPSSVT